MYYLPEDCTIEDVQNATSEQLWYSFHKSPYNYSDEVIIEMANELTLRGF